MQNFISRCLFFFAVTGVLRAQTYSKEIMLIETDYGNMKIRLFEETPLHKANFIKLVKEKYVDSLMFHRVINNFMIQGGDHLSKYAKSGDSLGHGEKGELIPAEFNRAIIHKKGRLCAARDGNDVNPKMSSSPTQFYIVMGAKRTMEDLKRYEDRINKTHYTNCAREFMQSEDGKRLKKEYNRLKSENKTDSAQVLNSKIEEEIQKTHLKTPEYKFDKNQIDTYMGVGGTPHLDGTYTVFGEVTEGLEVIDKIAAVKTDSRNRPLKDIRMKIRVIE